MSKLQIRSVVAAVLVTVLSVAAAAEVRVASIFGEHMVLQQGKKLPVWGEADAGEAVEVSLDMQSARAVASPDGTWRVTLDAIKAGGPYRMAIRGKSNTIEFKDVLAGEVWVGSGQSNMQWPVKLTNNAEKEIAEAKYPQIRLFTVPRTVAEQPQRHCGGEWVICSPETVPEFSAVAFYFGRMLHQELKTPVGLINTSWGGTPAESWTSQATLESDAAFKPILDNFAKILADYPTAKAKYDQEMEVWKQEAEKAKAEGREVPREPPAPWGPDHPWRPAGLYNAMICPIAPYAIQGAIWYQGESNADRAKQYQKLFPAMIEDWRRVWSQPDFPFLFVQLANFMERVAEPQVECPWAELREAQLKTLSLKNTGMAVIIDIGEAKDIHPRNKQDVGKRLALWALAKTYGRSVPYSGPLYKEMCVKGDEARLSFTHTDGGLKIKGGDTLKGFMIAGADKEFVWADARIKGKKVIVRSDAVKSPAAVRYAWASNPECNLYNGAGLPASPFRTDD